MSRAKTPKSLPARLFAIFSSYGLAVVLLLLLLALTYFGTLAQVDIGLYEASNKYFESLFIIEHIGPIPIPLPGVYLVSALLFFNLLCGAIIRARKSWRRPGMLIAHSGILFILLAGFVAYHYTKEGSMMLYPDDRSDEINNLTNWSIEVAKHDAEGKSERAYVVEQEDLRPLRKKGARRTFFAEGVPFEFEVYGYVTNFIDAKFRPAGLVREGSDSDATLTGPFVEGFALSPQKVSPTREENLPAAYLRVKDRDGKELAHTIISGSNFLSPRPVTIDVGGERWSVNLTRRRYVLPFGLKLEKFVKEDHPGTNRAREFSSDVVRIDDGKEADKYHISMNKPMRYAGFTAYQASWGPPGAGPDDELYTSLAIAYNPADQWPKYGTYVIAFGMAFHFMQKLFAYLRRSARSNKPKEATQ